MTDIFVGFNAQTGIFSCWVVLIVLWLISALFSKRTQRAESTNSRSAYLVLAMIGGAIGSGLFFRGTWMFERFVPAAPTIQFSGFAIALLGTLFAAWARLTLGSNWSGRATVKQNHELIVRGPYAIARHPIYTGLLMVLAGTFIVVGQWRCLFGFAVILLALLVKMNQEERLMTETFPEQYPRYRRRVKALVPFVF
jgi:protein-S-isoprenylcysteine O-methyltransferase Ste14